MSTSMITIENILLNCTIISLVIIPLRLFWAVPIEVWHSIERKKHMKMIDILLTIFVISLAFGSMALVTKVLYNRERERERKICAPFQEEVKNIRMQEYRKQLKEH
jgi:hypothetical protein